MRLPRWVFPLIVLVLSSASLAQLIHFGYWRNQSGQKDCYAGSPAIGDTCIGGPQYLGVFDRVNGTITGATTKYMVLPGGCNGTTENPSCSGSDDTSVMMYWNAGSSTGYFDTELTNITSLTAKDATDGRYATAVLQMTDADNLTAGIQSHIAANYCASMKYAGYEDWYLPTKSELAYIYCKAKPTGTHSASYPNEDANCVNYGGKQSLLLGFTSTGTDIYWSSTEYNSYSTFRMTFSNGVQTVSNKWLIYKARCIRRMNEASFAGSLDNSTYKKGFSISEIDFDYLNQAANPIKTIYIKNVGDIEAAGSTATITTGFAIVGGTCGAGQPLPVGQTCTLQVQATLSGRLDNTAYTGRLEITNSGMTSVVMALSGTNTNIPDPCLQPSPAIGVRCQNGAIYMGKLNWQEAKVADGTYLASQYMMMPSGCDGTTDNPACIGGVDSSAVTRNWNSGNTYGKTKTSATDIEATNGIDYQDGRLLTVSLINEDSDTTLAGLQTHDAAKYCYDMNFGGYEDWYLPTRTEAAYMYCKTAQGGTHSTSNPPIDPNCTSRFGGKEQIFTGFESTYHYWTATERNAGTDVWGQNFGAGTAIGPSNGYTNKNRLVRIRCVRRMDAPYFVVSGSIPAAFAMKYTLTGVNFNFNDQASTPVQELVVKNSGLVDATGVSLTVSAGFKVTGGTCSAVVPLLKDQTCTVQLQADYSGLWENGTQTGYLKILNGSGISLITLQGTISNMPDPCSRTGTPIGTQCDGGALYMGEYNWQDGSATSDTHSVARYMVMPSGCENSTTNPACSGTDSVKKYWNAGTSGNYVDTVSAANFTDAAAHDLNDGLVVTDGLAVEDADSVTAGVQNHQAAKYCADMVYAGYSDWYLPTKSELAFMLCKAGPLQSFTSTYPNEFVNCSALGGKQYLLYGFYAGVYWASSEGSASGAQGVSFIYGSQANYSKYTQNYVRCIRRY